jgi:excinuclease ABC subunit C
VTANPTFILREHVRHHAEDRPGVYRMMGSQDKVLYVGKSVRVKSRLLSYFRAAPGEKAQKLIREASDIVWDYVPNEFSALVKELRLIKQWRPRFNVEHKRRRRYAFIKVTRELAPRVIPVSRTAPDKGLYFGPFPRPRDLALSLRELSHLLTLRDCPGTVPMFFGDQLEFFQRGRTPRCLRAETESCLAPCCGGCSSADYLAQVEVARRFLEGRTRAPLRMLAEEMDRASNALDFEYAALLRDRLHRLDTLQKELVAFRGRVEGLSFVYRVPGFRGEDRLYLIRKGLVVDELPYPKTRRARSLAGQRVEEVFGNGSPAPASLSPVQAAETLLVARWFRLRAKEIRRTLSPEEWLRSFGPVSG